MANTKGHSALLRLALVGCGAISEKGYLPALRQLPGVVLSALSDANVSRAERLAARFDMGRAVSGLDDVIGEVDAVILATPPHVRLPLAEQAFAAGFHVLCEKPLANTGAECGAILSAAARTNRVLAVAHTMRFAPNRNHVHALLREGALGTVHSVEVEEGYPADWPSFTGYAFLKKIIAGGVLLNVGIHTLDTLFWWFGRPVDFEYEDDAIGGLESNVRIRILFEKGVEAFFRVSRTCTLNNRIVIKGKKGHLSVPVYDPGLFQMTTDGNAVTRRLASRKFGFKDMVAGQVLDFAESIATGRRPRVQGEDGMAVIEFIERCYAVKRSRPLPSRAPVPGLTW